MGKLYCIPKKPTHTDEFLINLTTNLSKKLKIPQNPTPKSRVIDIAPIGDVALS